MVTIHRRGRILEMRGRIGGERKGKGEKGKGRERKGKEKMK